MARPRTRRAIGILLAVAAATAAGWLPGPASAREDVGASRSAAAPIPTAVLSGPAERLPGGGSLAALGPADVARYRQIFALQKAGRFGEADQLAKALDDRLLSGHVLAQRYLHPKAYRAEFEELARWLEHHAELPQAQRIYRLAGARKPKGARMPAQPTGGYLVGAGQELKEESLGEGFRRRMIPGFDAWRAGDYAAAADRFTALVGGEDRKGEELAAAAFWAARAQLRARRPHLVAGSLRRAARASDGFYGLLAQRLLDETIRFEWQREELRGEMVALLLRYPAAKRAIALAQVGETDLAEAEVRRLAGRTDDRRDTQALTALAAALELPSAQMRLAQQLRLVDGRRHDGALFPIPRWQTRGGFRVDRALVYAVVRAESAFEIEAESPRGALGLMQVMPDTGNLVAKGANLAYNGPDDLLQPEINLEVGQIWLRRLMRTETVGDSLIHLIVAYNAGETRLKGWLSGELKGAPKQDPLLFIESVPIEESREYVKKVLANLWAYQARLGQPTPSLQALAENRWPSAGRPEGTAGLPVKRQVASASAQKVALAAPAAAGAKKALPGKVRTVVIRGKDVTVRRRAGAPAPASGSLGRVRWTGLARAR